jgi:homoserine trans-succinylase
MSGMCQADKRENEKYMHTFSRKFWKPKHRWKTILKLLIKKWVELNNLLYGL